MKVKPTNQEIKVDGNIIDIEGTKIKYDTVEEVKRHGQEYIECFIDGELEDRFMVEK